MRPGLPDPLVDLLGARWTMGTPVAGAAWFDHEAVAFGLADGTLAIARARWDGAATLQPREGGGVELVPATSQPPPVARVGVHSGPCLDIATGGAGTVLSGGIDGRLAVIGADGQVQTLADFPGQRIEHVAAVGGERACAVGHAVHRFGSSPAMLDLPDEIAFLAFEPSGQLLAMAGPGGVTLWSTANGATRLLRWPGSHRALAWSADGGDLDSGLEGRAAHGWRLADGGDIELGACQAPPLSLSYSAAGGLFATSGNPRVSCWQLGGEAVARRSECGVGSTVAVTRVACHPTRRLIAAGYENGAVLLCQPDSADVLFVRSAGGGGVSALAWSPDGAFLALAAVTGEIGVVAFPERLFRPEPTGATTTAATTATA